MPSSTPRRASSPHHRHERAPIEIKAKLADGKLKGEADVGGGRFTFESRRAHQQDAHPERQGRGREVRHSRRQGPNDLLPAARWVSSIEASRVKAGRVYVTFDGHASNDD